MTYSDAWMKAIEEYNGYGFASRDPKQRIDRTQASLMLGFKAWISKPPEHGSNHYFNLTKICLR